MPPSRTDLDDPQSVRKLVRRVIEPFELTHVVRALTSAGTDSGADDFSPNE